MRTASSVGIFVILLALAVGCDQKGRFAIPVGTQPTIKPPAAQSPASTAPAASGSTSGPTGAPIRAEDATGVWNQAQVEQYLTEELKLASVNIKSAGGADYRGTAVAQDGRNLTLAVQQVPGGIHVDYADDRGGSGSMSFGNMTLGDSNK